MKERERERPMCREAVPVIFKQLRAKTAICGALSYAATRAPMEMSREGTRERPMCREAVSVIFKHLRATTVICGAL